MLVALLSSAVVADNFSALLFLPETSINQASQVIEVVGVDLDVPMRSGFAATRWGQRVPPPSLCFRGGEKIRLRDLATRPEINRQFCLALKRDPASAISVIYHW
jgi:hypothetical protein